MHNMAVMNCCKSLVLLAFLLVLRRCEAHDRQGRGALSTLNTDCSCGFYDSTTNHLFTDALIVYFNETSIFSYGEFTISNFTHKYEKGWNTIYREGANSTNVQLANASESANSEVFTDSSLSIFINPTNEDHLVVGGEIRSVRQDMQYGSFSALVRGPPPSNGGSSMSMMFRYNETQEWEMDLLNTDKPETAWLATLFAGEFPDRSLGVNYTTLGNISLSNYTSPPWDYVELKVDWDQKSVNYSIGGVVTRKITREEDPGIPSVPGPLLFKHWSDGDKFSTQGPPYVRTAANIGWIRSFFNSSTMTKEVRKQFDTSCDVSAACSIADTSIRGSTAYPAAATVPWRQKGSNFRLKIFAIVIVSFGSAIGALVVFNATTKRLIERRTSPEEVKSSSISTNEAKLSSGRRSNSSVRVKEVPPPGSASSFTITFSSTASTAALSGTHRAVTSGAPSISQPSSSAATIVGSPNYSLPLERNEHQELKLAPFEVGHPKEDEIRKGAINSTGTIQSKDGKAINTTITKVESAAKPPPAVALHGGKPRIDYMAGMVAVCALMVTLIHYALTFLPALDSGYNAHYRSEIWGKRILAPYFLNAAWLGLFFTTSTRFLTVGYLRSGNLRIIAEKTVTRPFRLIIPVAGVVILEYFLIDCGATQWLEYLPSITWSTWPYTVRYKNFGEFMNELLELLYLIPNATPQITFNYCTGVLWTIPVTLQGSWISLLGVMIIYEIKNPWKRFGYYTLCILINWYAREWGSYFWAGLVLADLDVIYKYTKYIYARPILHWFLLIACLLTTFAMLTFDALLIDARIPLLALERGIHPDLKTGLPISQTENKGYPAYFEPRFNGLVFATVVQLGVEISPTTQKLFSSKILMWIFPHIFTIYLFHGLIFWTLGSLICIQLSALGVPYWANMLVTATSCWGCLFLVLPVVTPAVECLGKSVTGAIWRFGVEKAAKKEGTLWPFEKGLLLGRKGADPHVSANDEQVTESRFIVDEESGKQGK
jgi:hypothetical protein